MKPIAILIAGDPVPEAEKRRGNWSQMIRRAVASVYSGPWQDVDLRFAESLPAPGNFSALVVTGSSSSVVDREPWTLRGEALLRDAAVMGTPVLGICYGHQMLGQALGGRVARNPNGREIGTVNALAVYDDPILGQARAFSVNATHLDSVVELPSKAIVLARTDLEPFAAVRFTERIWGVQFHPEIDGAVIGDYIRARREQLQIEGIDADALLAQTRDTPEGAAILERFVAYASTQAS